MEYLELRVEINPIDAGRDIMMALLSEVGYESFTNDGDYLLAYIESKKFDETDLIEINNLLPEDFAMTYKHKIIPSQNWNEVWEKNYEAVIIGEKVSVRAPFHPKVDNIDYEIIIEPKMSFGTAHHATTAQIILLMMNENFQDKNVLDMGCGTAVLSIFASILGAKNVDAIDNDKWAFNNSIENIERNNCSNIEVFWNDAEFLDDSKNEYYDIIMANINRNILLNDVNKYSKSLKVGGIILMSGFYKRDLPMLIEEAKEFDLEFKSHIIEKDWTAAKWIKI